MQVIGIKLANGEELIARCSNYVKGEVTSSLTIDTPRVIGLQETQKGIGLGFMPYILGNPDAEITLQASVIASVYGPKAEIEKAYMSQTSKIQLMG